MTEITATIRKAQRVAIDAGGFNLLEVRDVRRNHGVLIMGTTQKLGLTATQAKVLGAIRELCAREDGIGPSFREIQGRSGTRQLTS